jgi:hypothetical protein
MRFHRRLSDPSFAVLLATTLVALRFAVYDHTYFRLETIPNHDMSQGFAFFATSMHSMRLTGEPAWWNPFAGGYAQHYQSFLSPLAPTTHHVVFLVWSQLIRLTAVFGIALPEYLQYLVVNYLVLPWLAYLGWIAVTMQLFRSRWTIAILAVVYAFSGIGLWHSAWFYFQEPATLNFLLAAYLAAMHRPTPGRGALLLLAAVIQATSLNYWTLYDAFFVGIVLGAHLWTHPTQLRRALGRLRFSAATVLLGLGAAATVAIWAVLLASIVHDQSGNYVRLAYAERGEGTGFTIETAVNRALEVRRYTIELFDPVVDKAIRGFGFKNGDVSNPMHDARYLGCVLLPFLALAVVLPWRRRERWLIASLIGVLLVTLATPLVVFLWKAVPMMDRIQHVIPFYTHFIQQLVVLLAGSALDAVLVGKLDAAARRRCISTTAIVLVGGGLFLVSLQAVSHAFPYDDVVMQANVLAAVLTIVPAAALLQTLRRPTARMRHFLGAICLALAVGDLTRYFRHVCVLDRAFTPHHLPNNDPLTHAQQHELRRAWPAPDPALGFDAGIARHAPIRNLFWPENTYLVPKNRVGSPPPTGPIAFLESPGAPKTDDPAGRIVRWTYNDFDIEAMAPADGWLFVPQLPDAAWRATVDGQPAAIESARGVGLAIPVTAGSHQITLEYRPLARSLYGPATALTFGFALGVLGFAAWSTGSFLPFRRGEK